MSDAADDTGPDLASTDGCGDLPDQLRAALAAGALAPILAAAGHHRVTGLLAIGPAGEVWLDAGRVYLANGPSSPSPFEVLVAAGAVEPAGVEQLWADADADTAPVLDQLLYRAPDADGRLRRLLHEHNVAALFELMVPGDEPVELLVDRRHVIGSRYAEPADRLLAVAGRRVELWRRIAERIPSTGMCFRMARRPPVGDERRLTADEWAFLALLDGRRSVADVIAETGESAFRVCALLYRMLLEQLIEPVPTTG